MTEEENKKINSNNNSVVDNDFIDHERLALLSRIFNEKQMNRYGEYKKSSIENRKNMKTTNIFSPPFYDLLQIKQPPYFQLPK